MSDLLLEELGDDINRFIRESFDRQEEIRVDPSLCDLIWRVRVNFLQALEERLDANDPLLPHINFARTEIRSTPGTAAA